MMKLFTAEKIRAWDAYTIAHEPIRSLDLMNRAAQVFTNWFVDRYRNTHQPVYIFAGTGNNGGDGLAVARNLHYKFYDVKVFVCDFGGTHSADFDLQMKTLPPRDSVALQTLRQPGRMPAVPPQAIVIDALFGSGLTRTLEGPWAKVIQYLNGLPNERVAIDLPSGLYADAHTNGPCIRATRTFSFETPKVAFLFPENAACLGEWNYGSIGLHPEYAAATDTEYFFMDADAARALLHPRARFDHKGRYGHALLIGGSYGKMGAAVLAATAALRAGVGLLTVHAPACGNTILQTAVPEAMFSADRRARLWTSLPDIEPYTAIGLGMGIGTAPETAAALEQLLRRSEQPMVLDADALNLIARHPEWWRLVPRNSILTPHPKEFERLFGTSSDDFARNALQRRKAEEYGLFIVLKGAYTAVAGPDGSCSFNATGNPGMATAGSGDVLTGVITALLAQGYAPGDAARLGVYLHGLAGDLAAVRYSQPGMVAGDIARHLGAAWNQLAHA